jgi:hypothetical protein
MGLEPTTAWTATEIERHLHDTLIELDLTRAGSTRTAQHCRDATRLRVMLVHPWV